MSEVQSIPSHYLPKQVLSQQNRSSENAMILEAELEWFTAVLDVSIKLYFCQECEWNSIYDLKPPELETSSCSYASFILKHRLSFDERIVLILALTPHIQPYLLDLFFTKNTNFDRCYSEFGGWKGESHGGFLPTGETAVFILAGTNLVKRFEVQMLFHSNRVFAVEQILLLHKTNEIEPMLSGFLHVSPDFINSVTTGTTEREHLHFPAKPISTTLEWDDLVLSSEVYEEIENVRTWIVNSKYIMEDLGLKKILKPGYRALFYGPPGTGKTLTASLLGKVCNLEVHRVDLSLIVSKYIGETEKNLAQVFDRAINKNWILFFDEADALFGKRTSTTSSNDRHANQEISYLLQKIEDFPGTILLASNLKSNIDEAFSRRFQSMIYFPMPDSEQRFKLWKNIFSSVNNISESMELREIAERYKLSGGSITNILRYCVIQSIQSGEKEMMKEDLIAGIAKELKKEGKTL